jgi:Flp pilus assembly protein TadG
MGGLGREGGFTAIWTAAVLMFLFGAAALAVDVSGFYQGARVDQTSADLACLAGVAELPDDIDAALTQAAANIKLNLPEVASATTTISGNQATLASGGSSVIIDAAWGGDTRRMRVQVTSSEPRTFSRIWAGNDVPVTQVAYCGSKPPAPAPGMLPMGTLPGTFSGDLFDCAAKVTGNCGAIDVGSGASDWQDAIAEGLDDEFEKHHGDWSAADGGTGHVGTNCNLPTPPGPCNALNTKTGNMVGPFNTGVFDRLSNVAGADCIEGSNFNCDSLAQVVGASPGTLFATFGPTAPSWWQTSLYGPYATAMLTQYYWDGDVEKCDSPRLATIPIVVNNDDWDVGDPAGTWPNGTKQMKIVGFYTVYIREPDHAGDAGNGNGNGLGQIVADIIWFGPDATCDGVAVNWYGTNPTTVGGIKLVSG